MVPPQSDIRDQRERLPDCLPNRKVDIISSKLCPGSADPDLQESRVVVDQSRPPESVNQPLGRLVVPNAQKKIGLGSLLEWYAAVFAL